MLSDDLVTNLASRELLRLLAKQAGCTHVDVLFNGDDFFSENAEELQSVAHSILIQIRQIRS